MAWWKVWKDEADGAERGRRKAGGARRRIDENMARTMVFLGESGPGELSHYLYSCN